MDMNTLSLLQALAPTVHPLDQTRALQECTALVNKYKARKQYHEQMQTAEVDIFTDKLPRTNNHPEDGVAAPWSERSKGNFLANVKTVFRLQRPCTCTASELCDDCKSECHADGSYQWAMDTDQCIKCAYRTMDGKEAKARTAMERLFSIATLCEMIHTPEALQARGKYLEHCRGVKAFHESTKRKRTEDEALVIDTDADLPMQQQPAAEAPPPLIRQNAVTSQQQSDVLQMIGMGDESDDEESGDEKSEDEKSEDEVQQQETVAPAPSPTGSDTGHVEEATDLLKSVRASLLLEHGRLISLAGEVGTDAKKKKQFLSAARDWLLFAAWLGVGDLYVDTLVPMRTDLETARFGHELQQESNGDLWFTTPRETGCTKTGKPIRWNITKHSPAVSTILLEVQKASDSQRQAHRGARVSQSEARQVGVTRARRPRLRPAQAGRTSAAAETRPLTAPYGNGGAQNCR
eukprot:COSAG06_NODE_240_length_19339_cov_16.770582_18_plen_463_part_00